MATNQPEETLKHDDFLDDFIVIKGLSGFTKSEAKWNKNRTYCAWIWSLRTKCSKKVFSAPCFGIFDMQFHTCTSYLLHMPSSGGTFV